MRKPVDMCSLCFYTGGGSALQSFGPVGVPMIPEKVLEQPIIKIGL